MGDTITIARRYNGPAGSGNGGYVCGLLAKHIEGPSEATLRAPPPLETPLTVLLEPGRVRFLDGDAVVGEARSAPFDLKPPPAPSLAQAQNARTRYRGLLAHRYPTCFVCGTGRAKHDGLELYTGAVEGRDMVADTWLPDETLIAEDGLVAPEFIHAALDCPSYWALPRGGEMAALLARLTGDIRERPPRGEELIVAAWALGSDGRKHRGATAVYGADGRVLACAEALWIEPKA